MNTTARPRTYKDLENHPKVYEIWREDDGFCEQGRKAIWVSLAPGYCMHDNDGQHSLHECTVNAMCREVHDARECKCKDCDPGNPFE